MATIILAVVGLVFGALTTIFGPLVTDWLRTEKGKKWLSNVVSRKWLFGLVFPNFIVWPLAYRFFKKQVKDDSYAIKFFLFLSFFMAGLFAQLIIYSEAKQNPDSHNLLIKYVAANLNYFLTFEGVYIYLGLLGFTAFFRFFDLYNSYHTLTSFVAHLKNEGVIDRNDLFFFYFGLREVIERSTYSSFIKVFKEFERSALIQSDISSKKYEGHKVDINAMLAGFKLMDRGGLETENSALAKDK